MTINELKRGFHIKRSEGIYGVYLIEDATGAERMNATQLTSFLIDMLKAVHEDTGATPTPKQPTAQEQ